MSTDGENGRLPDFLTPPQSLPEETEGEVMEFPAGPHEVSPWHTERQVSAPIAVARDRELARYKLDTGVNIQRIGELTLLLESGMETVIDHTGCELQIPLSRERVAALKTALDARKWMMDRTMPALKQMDVPDQKIAPKFSMKVKLRED